MRDGTSIASHGHSSVSASGHFHFGGHYTLTSKGVHFTVTSNTREAGGQNVHQDAALDPQGNARRLVTASIPMIGEDGNPIADYMVHIAFHSVYSPQSPKSLSVIAAIRKIAADLGVNELDFVRPNMDPTNTVPFKTDDQGNATSYIKPWDAWQESTNDGPTSIMPDGYYQDATGSTTLFRTYYQVPNPKASDPKEFDKTAHTYLELSAVLWRYKETTDYETRFQARIVFQPEWSTEKQAWGYRKEPFDRHQRAAIIFCKRMLKALLNSPPTNLSLQLRKLVNPSDRPHTNDPEGFHGLSQREMMEQERDIMQRVAEDDYNAAVNAINGNPPTIPAAAGESTVDIEAELPGNN
jgi:hypothetical protein